MPGLKDSIERVDRERRQRALNSQGTRELHELTMAEEKRAGNERETVLKRQARECFDKYLLPIFNEVASAKQIFLSEQKEAGDTSWFERYEYSTGSKGVASGKLIWDYPRQFFSGNYYFLEMWISDAGVVGSRFCPEINLLSRGGENMLLGYVEKLLVEDNGQTGNNFPSNEPLSGF